MNSTWRSIFSVSAARFYSLGVSTLALLITARTLGPAPHGVLAASVAWVSLFASLASLSIEQVAHYRIQLSNDGSWLPRICGSVLFLAAISSLFAVGIGLLLQYRFSPNLFRNLPPAVISLAFVLLPLIVFEQCLSSLLAASNRLHWYNWAQYAGRTLWLVLISAFLKLAEFDVHHALIAQISGQSLLVFLSFAGLRSGSSWKLQIDFAEVKELLKGASRLHLNSIGAFILGQSVLLFLNHFSTHSEVAWYQVANQMVLSLLVVPHAASSVMYSQISRFGPDRVWDSHKKMMMAALAVVFGVALSAFMAAPWFIPLLLGPQYSPAIPVFQWLLPTVVGLSFAQLMAPQWVSRGKFLWTTSATACVVLFNIGSNLIMVPKFHLMGAVWVSLLTYLGLTPLFQIAFALWCERQGRRQLA